MINISAKEYNQKAKKWEHKELFEEGSEVYLPKFKAKNAVNLLRAEMVETNPLIQDEADLLLAGLICSCWLRRHSETSERRGFCRARKSDKLSKSGFTGRETQLASCRRSSISNLALS